MTPKMVAAEQLLKTAHTIKGVTMRTTIELFAFLFIISLGVFSVIYLANHTPDFKKGLEQHLTRPNR
jgi:hypothetical protein